MKGKRLHFSSRSKQGCSKDAHSSLQVPPSCTKNAQQQCSVLTALEVFSTLTGRKKMQTE